MEITIGDIVRLYEREECYLILDLYKIPHNRIVYLLKCSHGKTYKHRYNDESRIEKVDISHSEFEGAVQNQGSECTWRCGSRHSRVDDYEGEKWFEIPNYEEKYHLSNFGRVKSLNYSGVPDCHKILSPSKSGKASFGDATVKLYGYDHYGISERYSLTLLAEWALPKNEFTKIKKWWEKERKEYLDYVESIKMGKILEPIDRIASNGDQPLSPGLVYKREVQSGNIKNSPKKKTLYLYLEENGFYYQLEYISYKKIKKESRPALYEETIEVLVYDKGPRKIISEFEFLIIYRHLLDADSQFEHDEEFLNLWNKLNGDEFSKNVKKDLLDLINWIMDDGTSPYNDKLTLSSAYYELSKSHVTLKEFTKALSLIKKTQELNIFSFNTDKILYLKAIINLNLNQNDEALKDFLIVKNNEDLREEVHCYIGECYYKIGKYEKSMSYFIDSLATNKDQYIRFKLGVCYFNTKIYDKAVHFFSEAIDMKPTPAAHYNRALSLLKINDLPKAKEDLVIAARNDIQNSKKLLERIENR